MSAIKDLEDWNDELKNIDMPYAVYQRERVVLELFKLYISLGEYLKAEILVAEICVDNPYAHLRIDLSLIKEAVFVKTKMWKSNICRCAIAFNGTKRCYIKNWGNRDSGFDYRFGFYK